ncbi:MAG: Uma2 family endonuclease, partial [Methylovulum sp.]|nr:Uma2 family endonuclease [Methylovulum sp.]
MSQVRQPQTMLPQAALMTEAEYLSAEQVAKVRHEFIDGRVYAMVGAVYNHNCIALNISSSFRSHLKGTPCTTFIADMKVRLGKDYVYP